jgi:hypothetical protein
VRLSEWFGGDRYLYSSNRAWRSASPKVCYCSSFIVMVVVSVYLQAVTGKSIRQTAISELWRAEVIHPKCSQHPTNFNLELDIDT